MNSWDPQMPEGGFVNPNLAHLTESQTLQHDGSVNDLESGSSGI